MKQSTEEIKEFVAQFIENYTPEVIEEDTVSFYNDLFIMLQNFNSLPPIENDFEPIYNDFISHVLKHQTILKEFVTFDFDSIKNLYDLHKNSSFKELNPIYTLYSFIETEEVIDQIFEEIKTVKEFNKELKEEINYLLDEYRFHLDHLKENMMYNFYTYDEFNEVKEADLDEKMEALKIEKSKFIQKCNDKLAKK